MDLDNPVNFFHFCIFLGDQVMVMSGMRNCQLKELLPIYAQHFEVCSTEKKNGGGLSIDEHALICTAVRFELI